MKHVWSVLCQKSSIDFENNILSIFGCIEEMNVVIDKDKIVENEKIVIPVEFQLVSYWIAEDSSVSNSLEIKGEFIDSSGLVLSSFENSQQIKPGSARFRHRVNIQGFPVTKEGRYYLKLWQKKLGGKKEFSLVAELPVDVKIAYQLLKKI